MSEDILGGLYPFMDSDELSHKRDKSEALRNSVIQKAAESVSVKQQFFATNSDLLIEIATALADTYSSGGRLLCAGNGGSSCDAAHLALEFMHPVTAGRPALPAINLSSDNAMITAIANDVGFDHVLPRQLGAIGQPNDLLVVFSTSGCSSNISAACEKAHRMGMKVVAFTGNQGGDLANTPYVDYCLIVESNSVHRIQECHLACYHILWDLVHTLLADHRMRLPGSY